jgi:L-threonylcarbamoyladenylate synthase
MPDEPLFRRVVTALGRPVAAPSANRSGRVSATTAADVVAELGDRVALVVDGGPSPLGLESTVVDLSGPVPRILRPGALESERIAAVLGRPGGTIERDDGETPAPSASRGGGAAALAAPGMLASHYAPAAGVRLDVAADALRPGEAYLAFGPGAPPAKAVSVYQLSEGGDLAEAARNLYHGLRALDRSGAATIAVAPIPARGLGIAIRDRLARAAAPRGNGG